MRGIGKSMLNNFNQKKKISTKNEGNWQVFHLDSFILRKGLVILAVVLFHKHVNFILCFIRVPVKFAFFEQIDNHFL